jgi:ATP-dependent DNA helicase DinG
LIRESTRAALSEGGALARAHPGFVARAGQLELADAIAAAIERLTVLVAEAGTGTGKTYAYLVPALLSGGRVMIATGTRNLQDQLFERDLPMVRDALGVSAQIALLKGRANYVCHHHLARNLADGRFARREDITDLRRIELFSKVSDTGDRSALSGVSEEAPAWSMATSTRENCLGQDCPDHGRCFVFKARQRAMQSDVVVVNHHLFCADLALRDEGISELLPTTSALVFDEAHQLPEIATQFFGASVSSRQLIDFARDALRSGSSEAADAADWIGLHGQMELAVRELRLHAGRPGRLDRHAARERGDLLSALDRCTQSVIGIGQALDGAAARGREVARCALRAIELRERLQAWIEGVQAPPAHAEGDSDPPSPAAPPERILWADVSPHSVTFHATPLSVAEVFRRHRDQAPRAWIFLSATLAIGGTLDHFASVMGIEDADKLVSASPFDFDRQAMLYVPRGLGDPGGPAFAERLIDSVWPLIVANRGRAFVLCTTLRMVERLSGLIADRIAQSGEAFVLLRQGASTRAELLERFRAETAPILVGSASFWEGVDVQGQQLSLVIIDKLPFAPPDDPILRARGEAARAAGRDPFRTLHLPSAAMALKQGAGRLIRSENDRGVLVVCDERLAEKTYGRALLRSLPPFRRTRDATEVLDFLKALESAH